MVNRPVVAFDSYCEIEGRQLLMREAGLLFSVIGNTIATIASMALYTTGTISISSVRCFIISLLSSLFSLSLTEHLAPDLFW